MKKVVVLISVLLAIVGCEKKRQPTIYANHDIEACGVKDPLVNMPWLAKLCEELTKAKYIDNLKVDLLKDTLTQENAFEIFYLTTRDKDDIHNSSSGYDCSGKEEYSYFWGGRVCVPPNPEPRDKFKKNKITLCTIFEKKY